MVELNIIMKKENIIKVLDIILVDSKNSITQSQANNYADTLEKMTEEDFDRVKNFYLSFITKYFQNQIK